MYGRLRKKYSYEEFLFNDSYIKKLYGMYIKRTLIEKILDKLVLCAIIFILMSLLLYWFMGIELKVLLAVNGISMVILLIFALELLRNYAQSTSNREFIRKHWIDMVLIMFLSFYFLFVSAMGFFRLYLLDAFRSFAHEAKNFRALFTFFRR